MSQNFLIDNLVKHSPSPPLNLSNDLINSANISKSLNTSEDLITPSDFSNLTQSMLFNKASAQLLSNLNAQSLLNNKLLLNKINSSFSNNSMSNNLLFEECSNTTETSIQSITKNNELFLSDSNKLNKTDNEKINSKECTPIRQTLSYLDVIFPHIRVKNFIK